MPPLPSPLAVEALGVRVGLDGVGLPFLVLTLVLWAGALASVLPALRQDARRRRLLAALLVAMAANIVVTLALDLVSFYASFAVMSFAAYPLVVHRGDAAALHAGRVYLVMVVLGEACLFGGLALVADAMGGTLLLPARGDLGLAGTALLVAGFGIKAGVVPLHGWLPLAHPVAPTPASAVLSGAMLKVGLLGWLRFLPLGHAAEPLVGSLLLGAGLVAMPGAALVGLLQPDAKTQLAYSSVSQMGLVAAAVGGTLLAPELAPAAIAAAVALAVGHAFAKGALFLGVGIVKDAAHAREQRAAVVVLALLAGLLAGSPGGATWIGKHALGDVLAGLPAGMASLASASLAVSAVTTAALLAHVVLTCWQHVPHADPDTVAPGGRRLRWVAWSAPILGIVGSAAGLDHLVPGGCTALAVACVPAAHDLLPGLAPLAGGTLAAVALRRLTARQTRPLVPPGDLLALVALLGRAAERCWGSPRRAGVGSMVAVLLGEARARGAAAGTGVRSRAARLADLLETQLRRPETLGAALLLLLALLLLGPPR